MRKCLLSLLFNTFLLALVCVVAGCGGGGGGSGSSSAMPSDPLNNWHWRNPLPQGNPLNGVTHGNGTFIALGDAGTILASIDGISWTSSTSGTTNNLTGVAYGNGIFIAVGGVYGTGGTI